VIGAGVIGAIVLESVPAEHLIPDMTPDLCVLCVPVFKKHIEDKKTHELQAVFVVHAAQQAFGSDV
jgi:hypothetical protein